MSENNDTRCVSNGSHSITPTDLDLLSAFVDGKVWGLPALSRPDATRTIWSEVLAAFDIRSPADIRADQLSSIRCFIGSWTWEKGQISSVGSSPIQRHLLYTDAGGLRQMRAIPHDAYVMTHQALLEAIAQTTNQAFTRDEVLALLCATVENLRQSSLIQRSPCKARRIALGKSRLNH